MHFFIFLFIFISILNEIQQLVSQQFCGRQNNYQSEPFLQARIVGGSESLPRSWPWMISIQKVDQSGKRKHHCGATLIEPSWAITAAHCVYRQNPIHFVLQIGSNPRYPYGKMLIQPEIFIWSPYYDYKWFTSDIALIKFTEPVFYDDEIYPICLPTHPPETEYAGEVAIAIGWGLLEEKSASQPRGLNHVDLPVLTREQCIHQLDARGFHSSWLCAGGYTEGKDACQGDSGGPLVIQINGFWNQIGIISAGVGCARPFKPGIYTKISAVRPWIADTIYYYSM